MRKIHILALAALGMLACAEKNSPENGGNENGGSTNPKEISCDTYVCEFDLAITESTTIMLTTTNTWSATTDVNDITIEPMSGQGSAFVKITSQKGGAASEGKIMFSTNKASATIVVKRINRYPGSFSIGDNKRVYFAHGNLQYQASSQTWRFAGHQYDIIGEDNKNISSSYSGWIDLFGWGTGNNPTKTSTTPSSYSSFVDWGRNSISNANPQTGWRTPTIEEWEYMLRMRTNASDKRGIALVNGVKGCVFLPDIWEKPSSLTFIPTASNYETNTFTTGQWYQMEEAGAIFLPSPNITRKGANIETAPETDYWSSTINDSETGKTIYFNYNTGSIGRSSRYMGWFVRLVKDIE